MKNINSLTTNDEVKNEKINDWIYVGNGFIEKKNLMEIENVKK